MKFIKNPHIDKTFWMLYLLLVVFAILALFSASSTLVYKFSSTYAAVGKQIMFLLGGLALAYVLQFMPSRFIRRASYVLLGISIILVYIPVLFPEAHIVEARNEAARWIKVGGITFQPSELAKLFLVIVVSDLLSRIKTDEDKKKYFFWTLGITVFTAFPILLGNLSTCVLIGLIVLILWILAHVKWYHILGTIAICAVVAFSGYMYVEKTYVEPNIKMDGPFGRATTWVSRIDRKLGKAPQEDKQNLLSGDNRQETIAHIAIMRGGTTPVGVLPGNSKERNFLPLAFADYIFAIIVEETGIVGAVILSLLYLAILFRACLVSSRYNDYAAMLMVMGLALMITVQALISMWVAVGLFPVTGQPLPMISRGGTSVLITSAYFGIILCVSREQNKLADRSKSVRRESEDNVPEIEV